MDKLSHLSIFLKDENHNIIRYTECDENGEFIFNSLPMGDYFIEGDFTNLYSTAVNITLTDSNPQQSDVELDFICENPNGYETFKAQELLISEIYPNPAVNLCQIDILTKEKSTFNLSITSVFGTVLQQDTFTFLAGKHTLNIPISSFSKGSYIISIIDTKTQQKKHIKFIK
jgi:hypothetical protein